MTSYRPWPLCRHDALYDELFRPPQAQSEPTAAQMDAKPRVALLDRSGTPHLARLLRWRRQGLVCMFLHGCTAPLSRRVQDVLGLRCVHLGPLKPDDTAWVGRLAMVLRDESIDVVVCMSDSIHQALSAHRGALPSGLRIALSGLPAAQLVESSLLTERHARRLGPGASPAALPPRAVG